MSERARTCVVQRSMVCGIVLLAGLLMAVFNAEAKTTVTREYDEPSFSIIDILDSVLPDLECKITARDKDKATVSFVTKNKREMSIRIVNKGKQACSVEVSGSAWFSKEPEEVAERVHGKIKDVLVKREEQKRAEEQKRQPIVHCPKCGEKFGANGTYVGRLAGTAVGAGVGAKIGAGIGIVAGPFGGMAGTIPGAIIGGAGGFWAGRVYDNNICPKCGHRFKQ